jgi:multidrug efflux pump subunit AcrB
VARQVSEDQRRARYETPAVTIAISKKAGENASTVADGVVARVAAAARQLVPMTSR